MPSMGERLIVRSLSVSSCLSLSCFSLLFTSSLPHSDQHFFSNVNSVEGINHCAFAQRGVLPHGDIPSSTGYEPNVLDDFHYSETSEMIFQEESGDIDTEPSYLCDAELDDETIGKALTTVHPGARRISGPKTTLSLLWRKFIASSVFFAHTRTGRPVHELSSCRQKPSREMENETIRILFERHKEQILADFRAEIQKHEFQADSDRRSIQEMNGIIESQRREKLIILLQVMNNSDEISYFFMRIFTKLISKVYEMEALKRVQESRVEESSRRWLIKDRDTVHEFTARIQELQNEINCLNDSRDFKDAESVRSGLSQPAVLPLFRDPGGMLSRKDKPPDTWDTHGFSGNVFVNLPSNIRLLEDKVPDWGMYFFTISYGSYDVDQRSGVGWFSGWIKIFVLCERNSHAEFWSTRCEDCFSTEQNHP